MKTETAPTAAADAATFLTDLAQANPALSIVFVGVGLMLICKPLSRVFFD